MNEGVDTETFLSKHNQNGHLSHDGTGHGFFCGDDVREGDSIFYICFDDGTV